MRLKITKMRKRKIKSEVFGEVISNKKGKKNTIANSIYCKKYIVESKNGNDFSRWWEDMHIFLNAL